MYIYIHISCILLNFPNVGLLGILEKCNPHTLWAFFDIAFNAAGCWKSATLTHFGHFLTSCWTFGNNYLKNSTVTRLGDLLTSLSMPLDAGKVQPSHTSGTFAQPLSGLLLGA